VAVTERQPTFMARIVHHTPGRLRLRVPREALNGRGAEAVHSALAERPGVLQVRVTPLAGSLLGFLCYNFSRATMFLGDSGALLYGLDPHRQLAPASLTKIFTALVALRFGDPRWQVDVQFDPAQLSDSTLMGIHPGETYTLEDLLYGLLLPSGNDAALAIGNAIGGSDDHFVAMMNEEVTALGLHDSHFVNPHGLDAPDHYSSAYDMAMAARYGMTHYPEFRQLVSARTWTVHGTRTFPVDNLNRFLWSYPGADGVKVGYTDAAGHTIVASASRNGHRVYVVLMNCGDIVSDAVPLFNWVFANFSWPG